jgi:thiamine biosynthesis lipoprotein
MLHELAFPAMGTTIRLLASDPARLPAARAELERLAAALTRFDPASELCRLNADPRGTVPASADLRDAVRAALHGAAVTGGLADPTLLGELERAGYARSLAERPRAALGPALAGAPARRAAAAHPAARYRLVAVDDRAVTRPPGLRLDLGGSAKGFIADRVAALLAPAGPCAVDCGGDMRVHGDHAVAVRHPLGGEAAVLELHGGAVATSGIDARLWETGDTVAHHLIDPATGRPAWTGVLTATAVAPTAAEAEARAKAALLAGPLQGRALLRRHGGVLVREDGRATVVDPAPRVRRADLVPARPHTGSVPNEREAAA